MPSQALSNHFQTNSAASAPVFFLGEASISFRLYMVLSPLPTSVSIAFLLV